MQLVSVFVDRLCVQPKSRTTEPCYETMGEQRNRITSNFFI